MMLQYKIQAIDNALKIHKTVRSCPCISQDPTINEEEQP